MGKTKKQFFYLASSSKPRSDLLRKLGFNFKLAEAKVLEHSNQKSAKDRVIQLALRKAKAAASRLRCRGLRGIVVGFDSLVFCNGKTYGKPKTIKCAVNFLSELQGKTHSFYTGVAGVEIKTAKKAVGIGKSRVMLIKMSSAQIQNYVRCISPLGAAGAYKIQDGRLKIVKSMKGDRNNVVGVPIKVLRRILKRLT